LFIVFLYFIDLAHEDTKNAVYNLFYCEKNLLFGHFQLHKLNFSSRNFNYFELEIVEFYHFMHFGKALVMVQDETADSLIFIAFGQIE